MASRRGAALTLRLHMQSCSVWALLHANVISLDGDLRLPPLLMKNANGFQETAAITEGSACCCNPTVTARKGFLNPSLARPSSEWGQKERRVSSEAAEQTLMLSEYLPRRIQLRLRLRRHSGLHGIIVNTNFKCKANINSLPKHDRIEIIEQI